MEVQADVQKERCSLSGESATVSLGTISDNASTKAMAGSILNAYMPLERSALGILILLVASAHFWPTFKKNSSPSFSCTSRQKPCRRNSLKDGCCVFMSVVSRKGCWKHIQRVNTIYAKDGCRKSAILFCRDNSLDFQTDVESKQALVRQCSASSSLDEASCSGSTAGLKAASGGTCSCPSTCCCVQHDDHCCPPSPWSKEPSTSGSMKRSGKLWTRASSSYKGDSKMSETRGDMEAQLLEQRSTNSSEFDSPSLSGSLPSVADSHCSHFSSELSCSDPETSRPAPLSCPGATEPHLHRAAATAFHDVAITPMPEVENDRLEHYPPQSSRAAFTHRLLSSSPPASPKEESSGTVLHISEESGCANADTAPEKDRRIKETTKNAAAQPVSPTRNRCLPTDIWRSAPVLSASVAFPLLAQPYHTSLLGEPPIVWGNWWLSLKAIRLNLIIFLTAVGESRTMV